MHIVLGYSYHLLVLTFNHTVIVPLLYYQSFYSFSVSYFHAVSFMSFLPQSQSNVAACRYVSNRCICYLSSFLLPLLSPVSSYPNHPCMYKFVPSSPHTFCFNVCDDILYVFSPCTCGFGFIKPFTFSFVDLCHQLIKDCLIKPCCLLCLHFDPQLYTPYSLNNMQLVTSAYFIIKGLKN